MTYRSEVLADAPTHYWPLAEGGGTITADLISTGGQGASVTPPLGYAGITSSDGAALINNTNNNGFIALQQQAYLPAPPGVGPYGGFSMEVWVWLWGFGGTYQVGLMYGVGGNATFVLVQASGIPGFQQAGGAGAVNAAGALSLNNWHHIVGVASTKTPSAGTASIYVDGALSTTNNTFAPAFPASSLFAFGTYTDRTQPTNGFIASPALYANQLSAARVLAHYNAAELRTNNPVFLGAATTIQINAQNALLAQILAAVRKTF